MEFENDEFEKYNVVMNKLHDYIICEKNLKNMKHKILSKLNVKKHTTNNNNTTNNNTTNSNNNSSNNTTNSNNNTSNNTTNSNNNTSNNNNYIKKQETLYYPRDQDALYWIFYIMQNGIMDYEYNKNKRFIIEKNDKINYIENIKQHKEIIKRQKIISLSDFENNLIVEKKININTFLNLCAIKKINVIVVKNKIFYELLSNDDEEVFIIYNTKVNINCSNYEKFGFETCKKKDEKWNKIYSQYFQTNNIMCPIKSISFYKLDDLINMCEKFGLSVTIDGTSKKKKKSDLYEQIIQHLS
jgi:hypothetical protein|uniref:Uncharacterized protein n=1 Tax=viral metagenome TaxID=1070528 RepID=A0A6C0IML5_9ZZZZ